MNVIGHIQTSRGAWLAERSPIALGRLIVRPSALEVAGAAETVTLEPRCMKVLVTLCDRQGETVSRDAMIDLCWDGRIVTDAALNRSIAQVRKALALDPDLEIETIPRIGYRLRTPAAPIVPVSATAALRMAPNLTRWALATAMAVTIIAIIAGLWFTLARPQWRGDQVRPVATDTGLESYPALSPRGDRLAYARQLPDGAWQIHVRSIDGGEDRVLTTTGSEIWPGWRPDGEALAFVHIDGQACTVVMLDMITSARADLAACDPAHVGRPTFAGPDRLLYSDALPNSDQHAVYSLSLSDRTARPVSTPPSGTHGDMDPIVSPDGKRVLFRRIMAWGVDDLMIADLTAAGALANAHRITDDGWKAHGVAWLSDSRTVVFSSNRGGDWGLWAVNLSGDAPQRISLGTASITKIGGGPDGRLAIETYHARSDLRWLDGPAIRSVMADVWTVSLSRNGDLAYVSNESGSPELWLQSGDRQTRLTRLKSSYLHETAWNPAGDAIVFVAVKDRTPQLFSIPAHGGQPVQLTDLPGDKGSPVYLADGQLLWLGRGAHGWRLATAAQAFDGLGDDWESLKAGPGGVFGARTHDANLYRLMIQSGAVHAERTTLAKPEEPFAVARDGIMSVADGRMVLTRWNGARQTLAALSGASPQQLAYDPKSGRVLAVDRSGNESGLALMTLSRR